MPDEQPPDTRNPSTLYFQKDGVRRGIIAAYWLVIISALPLWWWTTSIERLALPSTQVALQNEKHFKIPVEICIDDAFGTQSLMEGLEATLKQRIGAREKWDGLDIQIHADKGATAKCTYRVVPNDKVAILQGRTLGVPLPARDSIADALMSLVGSSPACADDLRVIRYAPRYRLSFSLLYEDAAAGGPHTSWDIINLLKRHIDPITRSLSTLHNFTIESQVQLHAPLAFSPIPASEGNAWGISREDLSVFINSAEWTLSSSSSNDPVLHFVLFIPSAARQPLYILDEDGSESTSNSFLLPQWGGIVVHNPQETQPLRATLASDNIDIAFSAFSKHLLTLLGAPNLPDGVESAVTKKHALNEWQLDALLRCRALSNARGTRETLQSIISLVDQIPNMPVGRDVRDDIQGALTALEQMHKLSDSLIDSVQYSARALTLASRAFFNPGMLALLYFPAEHKYAVYTPMFASAFIPPFVAVLREISAWKRQRRQPIAPS